MKAMRIHKPGGPLQLDEVPIPKPGPNDALIKLKATGVGLTTLNADVSVDTTGLITLGDLIGAHQLTLTSVGADVELRDAAIQALIIENAVPQIEKEANAILAQLTDNRIQISIESLRDLKQGGTRETLDVKISDELGERSYHLYSGGEAFRTDFALRIALSKVLAMRSGTRLRTLFIDEGFGTQDQQGLEQLVEAIQIISRDFDKVLVVTHLEQLKAAFPVQIEVTKHPDLGSRFEIMQHG